MNQQTIKDVYATNNAIREKTKQIIASLSDEQTAFLPDGEKWTIAHIIEHVAIVQDGMSKISAKLLKKAQNSGKQADGAARFSESFVQKAAAARDIKLEAPDQVHPTGNQTVTESLKKMDETQRKLEELQPLFESVECLDFKFPHPFMGDLTAHEWLALVGGHEARHLRQIEKMLEKH